jgi:hypothetical protein
LNKNLLFALLITLLPNVIFQPVANAASIELVPSSRVVLKITSGMTIDEIIMRVYPQDKDIWPQIKEKLIETNPGAFVQYSDRLITGTRLKLVDVKRIQSPEVLVPKIKVGHVARLGGQASARDINGGVLKLRASSPIFEGDRLETEPGARLYILMDDGAQVHLKGDSVLKISEYVITDGYDESSSSVLDLLRGGLRKLTGAIGASALSNYQLQTGLATIGIRGTEYVIKLCKLDDCSQTVSRNDPDAKLHAVVLKGAISLTNDEEVQILMAMGEYGTATPETLSIEDEKQLPVGFLDVDESQIFNTTIPQQVEQQQEEEVSYSWMWIVGALLLVVGL